jgi:hypothetical protein
MLIPVCVFDDVFPALSVQVPVEDWPEPSVVTVWLILLETGPDVVSVQLQFTVTLPLFQPAPFGAVRFWNVVVGAVVSRLIVTD